MRLATSFPTHPKVIRAGGDAAWLYVCILCWCGEHETDGHMPRELVARVSDRTRTGALVSKLVDVGLLEEAGDELVVHDYLHYQMSAKDRDAKRSAGRIAAGIRWGNANRMGDPEQPDANGNGSPTARRNATPNTEVEVEEEIPPPVGGGGSGGNPRTTQRATSKSKRGSRLPDRFVVDEAMEAWVKQECPGLAWQRETRKFTDHFRSQPGQRGIKLDWTMTWRNWMRRAAEGVR